MAPSSASFEGWSSCKPHHLRCIHKGYVLVAGRAPDELTFILGEREVAAYKLGLR